MNNYEEDNYDYRNKNGQLQLQLKEHKNGGTFELDHHTTSLSDEELNASILRERNEEIKQITNDVGILSEIFQTIQHMIHDQGLDVDIASKSIESTEVQTGEAVKHLEKAENHQKQAKSVRDAGIIVSGAAIGSVGWIGGPIIGVPTTAVGVALSVGIVCILRKIGI